MATSCLLFVAVAAAEREPAAENPLADLATLEYRPAAPVEGSLALAGSRTLEQAAAFWAEGFRQLHPARDLPTGQRWRKCH